MPLISWLMIGGCLIIAAAMVGEPYWERWYAEELERLAARSLELAEQGTESYIVIFALRPILFVGRKALYSLTPSETREFLGKEFTLYQVHASRMFIIDI